MSGGTDDRKMIYPESALILAPLSGYTDWAYRRAARRCGCRFCFTEMVDCASLVYASERGRLMLYRGGDEDFLGVQLVGAVPEHFAIAARKLNDHDFSLLDINLGCPVPKVFGKGAGAALGRNRELAFRCFEALAENSRFPLTAKMRIVCAGDPGPTVELARGLVERGARAITVHGRTREGFYSGEVDFAVIRAVREALPHIPVIANGGVISVETARIMREKTGCSRLMLAQGAMGNPWLFSQIAEGADDPVLDQWKELVRSHVSDMVSLYGEETALRCARKIVHDYLKGRGFPAALRAEASALVTMRDLDALLAHARPAVSRSPSIRSIRRTEEEPGL
ncbi:MAG: tRNA-dihydrouridine synthase family protein [Lentisphaeria bacterium]|nr:tRNA-dihydrouridine synthase family protein [Lentisphaeria bacterium]